jgi:hypothetical protein
MRWIVAGMVLATALVVVIAVLVGSAHKERKRAPRVPRPEPPALIVPLRA